MIIKNYLQHPFKSIVESLQMHQLLNWMSDRLYLKIVYRAKIGKKLNINNPCLYNEKLQWLKLYDRREEYQVLVDKYRVREYISNTLGEEYLIPLLGKWDSPDEIEFDKLPNQFVLKCNHDSGSVLICKDKANFDQEKAKQFLSGKMATNHYYLGREWPYKSVKPCIIAEKYMTPQNSDALVDYKYFCFNGEPKIMYWSKDKAEDPRTDFFDMNFNHLPIRMRDPNSEVLPDKPINFEKMKAIAKQLSKDYPHVRIDFYEINGKIYFGEFTFYHCSGFAEVKPEEWNHNLGNWIVLPKRKLL